jgi:hypothetical protein
MCSNLGPAYVSALQRPIGLTLFTKIITVYFENYN